MKTYVFCVCLSNGLAEFADIIASSPSEAVRALVARFPNCRANIVSIY
jgi:hypothetical protein